MGAVNGAVGVGVLAPATVAVAGVGLALSAPRWARPDRLVGSRRRLSQVGSGLRVGLGDAGAALAVVAAGGGTIMLVGWLLGRLAKVVEPGLDVPAFGWFQDRQEPRESGWAHLWRVLTNIGSLTVTQTITVVAAIILAALYRRRRWWAPPAVLVVGYSMEKLLQEGLKLVVHRGHPPTTLGTWPSGGCARVVIVYGLVVFLLLRLRRTRDVRSWVAGWSLVAFAATVQAYARTYNLEHWLTDVFGGLVVGLLVLVTLVAAGSLVLDEPPEAGH
jgi:membrane-associated phospholipid phosphatase